MLYHASTPERALAEIKRVLKSTGYIGILLSGANNMQTLFTLLDCENPRQAPRFSAETAAQILPSYFANIKECVYHNILKVTEVAPLIAYIRSLSNMGKKDDAFYSHCRKILSEHIQQNGAFTLPTSRHLFILS